MSGLLAEPGGLQVQAPLQLLAGGLADCAAVVQAGQFRTCKPARAQSIASSAAQSPASARPMITAVAACAADRANARASGRVRLLRAYPGAPGKVRSSRASRSGSVSASIWVIFPVVTVKAITENSCPCGATTAPAAPLTSAGLTNGYSLE